MENYYKVFYQNVYQCQFAYRDTAMRYIMTDANLHSRSLADYDILDRSDYLCL